MSSSRTVADAAAKLAGLGSSLITFQPRVLQLEMLALVRLVAAPPEQGDDGQRLVPRSGPGKQIAC
jgi:hypothetical protein